MGEEYRDAHFCETEIASLPYRCGGIVCMVIEPYYHRGFVSSTGERCSPLQICCRWVRVSAVYIRFSSYVRGMTFGIMSQVLHTQNITMHAHVLIQVLYSLFQNLSSYSLSRRACTCPQVSKTLSTYTRKTPLLLHKKCNNCRNVAKLNIKSFVCTSLAVRICAVITQNYYRNIDEDTRKNSASMQLSHNFNLYQYMRF